MSELNLINSSLPTKSNLHNFGIIALGFMLLPLLALDQKLMIKYIGKYSSNEYLFFRSTVIALISAFFLKKNGIKFFDHVDNLESMKWILLRNIFNFIQFSFFLASLNYLRISTASLFTSLGPVFSCIGCVLLLKEKFYSRYLIGLLICLCGTILVVNNDKGVNTDEINEGFSLDKIMNNIFGGVFGIMHSIFHGLQGTMNKKLLNLKIDSSLILFYMGIILTILSAFSFILSGSKFTLIGNLYFILITALDGVILFTSLSLNNYATKNIDLVSTTGISYIMIVESFILGVLIFGDTIALTDILGSVLIISYNFYHVFVPLK